MADEAAALVQAGAQHVIVGFRAPFDASRLEPIAHALAEHARSRCPFRTVNRALDEVNQR